MEHLDRALRVAVEQKAGVETARRFVDWVMANFTDEELETRRMLDLWFRWCDIERSR